MRDAASIPFAVNACSKIRRWLSVSTVDPDLDDTTITVAERSPASASATWAASVVSSTVSGTPAVPVITSGASDDPPIPASTIRSSPSARSSARRASISASRGREVSCSVVQDSRIADSDSASWPHRVGSCAVSLDANSSETSPSRSPAASSASRESTTETDTSPPCSVIAWFSPLPCSRPSPADRTPSRAVRPTTSRTSRRPRSPAPGRRRRCRRPRRPARRRWPSPPRRCR